MQNKTVKNQNLLIIDDDLEITKSLDSQFKTKYAIYTATSVEDGLSIIQQEIIQVIISAQRIPGMTGVDFFASIKDKYPDIIKVILTGYSDIDAVIGAINDGQVFRYLKKPWNPVELDNIIKEAFEKYDLIIQNRILTANLLKTNAELEEKVNKRTNELKRSHEILKESRNRFQLLYENAPLSYQSLNPQACLIDVNKRWLETMGYEKEEVLGRYFGEFMTPESAELIKERFPAFVATGSLHDYVFDMVRKDGTIITVTYDGTIGYDEFGSFKQTHCIFQDITQKRTFEDKIKESEEKFRGLFESSLVGKSITTPEGKLELNTAFCEILGYSKEELNNKNWREITHKEDIEQNEKKVESILNGEVDFKRWEKRFIHKDGHIVWGDIIILLKRDEKGNPLYFITEIMDISQGKKTEEELEESEEKFRELFESSLVGKSITTLDGKLDTNTAFCDILGYSRNELSTKNWREITHADDIEQNEQNIKSILKDEVNYTRWEKRYIHKQGYIVWVDIVTLLKRDEKGNPLYFITEIMDISQGKKTEEELEESEEKFRELFESSLVGKSITTLDGKLDTNTAFCDILGYSRNELSTKNWREITHADDIEQNEQNIKSILKDEVNYTRWEKRYIHKQGYIVWVDIVTLLRRDRNGKPLDFITEIVDISQSKQAEKKLEESEFRYRSLVNTGQALIWTSGLDKKCNFFNEIWLAFTGRKKEQELGDGWVEGVHPDDLKHCSDIYVDGFDKRTQFSLEFRIRHHSGEYRWIQENGSPRYDNKGVFIGFIGHCLDITVRKQVEISLARTQQLHREMERVGKVGGWEFNIDTLISVWTDETYRIHELDYFSKTTVDSGENYYTTTSRPIIEEAVNRAITQGESFDLELEIITAKGNLRNIHTIGQADIDNRRVYGFFQDITERKQAEKALIESEAKLSALFSGMTEMVVFHELVFDEIKSVVDYRIIDCNDTFTRITGIQKENAIGKLASELYNTEKAPFLEEYANVCITGEKIHFQTYFQLMDKHFIVSAISLGNNQFSTVTTDITEIQNSKETIIRSNKELENYIYVASHDLRSPLVNIQGFSQRLQKQTMELQRIIEENKLEGNQRLEITRIAGEDMPKSLNYVQTNVTKMDQLINGLLKVSRTGRMSMNPRKIDMNKFITSVIGSYNFQLTEINAEVKINNLTNCFGDENQLNPLFSNLISNAIKYRSTERKLNIEISSESHYSKVIYSVKDNGIGIHQKYLGKMWDVFFRVDNTNNDGDGVGLSIVKKIVDTHKGKIWLESEEGVGSVFFVELHKDDFGI